MKIALLKPALCFAVSFGIVLSMTACQLNIPSVTDGTDTSVSASAEETGESTAAATTVPETTVPETTAPTTADTTADTTPGSTDTPEFPTVFPLLDSSTARIPITEALYEYFVGEFGLTGPRPICSKTHGAWLNLIDDSVDMILCIAPTDEEQAYMNEKEVDVEMRLYGCDGLVFLGNSANPVKNLTQDQIKGIYRGEITNWSELGGPSAKINAYYRDDQSGSQRFFEDLVWKGEEIPDFGALGLYIEDDMSDITMTVIDDPFAIGFNIMSYIDLEFSDPNLMLFSVDDVAPGTPTLADASYPYITQAYIIIRADEPADSPARWLFNWFGCDKSRDILEKNSSLSVIFSDPILLEHE